MEILFCNPRASAAKQSRNTVTAKTGLPRLLRRLAMTLSVSFKTNYQFPGRDRCLGR
jgi:hypothetical protein